ncbi:nuclear transport factor 2 family protein [Spirosoma aureum]|uniref:Nuclear transport factor 2 family protein n=1 Tax=Spirosoma aureum TaxID=2692134 RepID=A0A6G9AW62_9BACT|nr:nuclear transport factor 2 family protein [Spirosoma aureum]QIP16586.1 nuclear transport factor 2 family protein [Spirosoma aureum]
MSTLEEIQLVEQRLREAMLGSNIEELDALLSDELLVTGPDGKLVGKADDLAAHRTGIVRIESMVPQETIIKILPETAVVFALMAMQGFIQDQAFAGLYRYTRVWSRQTGNWQIVAAHISPAT